MKKLTKKIVVTGGLGFIGSYFVDLALREGYRVINIDKKTYAARRDLAFDKNPGYKLIVEDIAKLQHLPEGIDYIVNFAAESHVDNSIVVNNVFFESNIRGVYNLVELIRAKDPSDQPTLIHISTDEVYGTIMEGSFTEEDKLNPSNPYAATKAAADQLIIGWQKTYGIKAIICRSSNNYGYGQYSEKLLPKTIDHLLKGKKMTIHGDGSYRREWTYAKDNCMAILKIMDEGKPGDIYNISSNEEYSVLEVVDMILDEFGLDRSSLVFVENRWGQDRRYSVNCDKVKELGWKPKMTLRKYIPTYIKLYKENYEKNL